MKLTEDPGAPPAVREDRVYSGRMVLEVPVIGDPDTPSTSQ